MRDQTEFDWLSEYYLARLNRKLRDRSPLSPKSFYLQPVLFRKYDVITAPQVTERSIAMRMFVSLSVGLSVRISEETSPNFDVCFLWPWLGSPSYCVVEIIFMLCTSDFGWLVSRVASVLDSGAEGPGFKSQSQRCRVTVLGASHPLYLCSPSSKIGSSPLKGCGGNSRPSGK